MSQSTNLILFTCSKIPDPAAWISRFLEYAKIRQVLYVTRSSGEDRSWEKYQNQPVDENNLVIEDDDDDNEELISDCLPAEIPSLYESRSTLRIDFGSSHLGNLIGAAIQKHIPDEVRGSVVLSELSVSIGFHDLFETAEHEEGFLVARPFLSIKIWGYSTPLDCDAMQRLILLVSSVQKIKKDLERFSGPLEQCLLFDF